MANDINNYYEKGKNSGANGLADGRRPSKSSEIKRIKIVKNSNSQTRPSGHQITTTEVFKRNQDDRYGGSCKKNMDLLSPDMIKGRNDDD